MLKINAPASAPSCCGADDGFRLIQVRYDQHKSLMAALDRGERKGYLPDAIQHEWDAYEWKDARAQPCRCGELREAAANYVRCVQDLGLSAYILENGRNGKSPWAELLEALAAIAPRSGESKP